MASVQSWDVIPLLGKKPRSLGDSDFDSEPLKHKAPTLHLETLNTNVVSPLTCRNISGFKFWALHVSLCSTEQEPTCYFHFCDTSLWVIAFLCGWWERTNQAECAAVTNSYSWSCTQWAYLKLKLHPCCREGQGLKPASCCACTQSNTKLVLLSYIFACQRRPHSCNKTTVTW